MNISGVDAQTLLIEAVVQNKGVWVGLGVWVVGFIIMITSAFLT
jgi:hypothetical protein